MALGALRNLAVDAVTEGAVKSSMFAGIVLELGNLRSVAGNTGICYLAGKRNVQRHVRVFVAVQATLKFKVGLPHMALAAKRNGFLDFRRMPGVTACTADILVFPSG